ncbi:hypothetical protein [Actinoplanes auranticolor]|uniref:Lipoprotein n=1 Tax=Actinoplanes auranticolor TaxID=47988 RepID=A0A919S501_9ACTN|nr:hypothetical protein [Actinoplanes auranticolor]GIM63632.1 hypothetical protein Aau02nite_05280 [Actinoplanes auranticolor]
MIRLRSTALLLTGGLSLAACSQPVAPAPADPKAAVTASLAGLTAGNYAYMVATSDRQVTGTTDFPSASAAWYTTFTDPEPDVYYERVIGEDRYNRTTPEEDRWQHWDLSRMPEAGERHGLAITRPDRTGATELLGMMDTATVEGSTIRGTLAVTTITGSSIVLQPLQFRLKGRTTFTATLDGQGRLSRLVVDVPATTEPLGPAGTWTLDITGYGTTPAPTRPTPTKEAPEDLYETETVGT